VHSVTGTVMKNALKYSAYHYSNENQSGDNEGRFVLFVFFNFSMLPTRLLM